jgi:uncharacterized protein (DUF433 family)
MHKDRSLSKACYDCSVTFASVLEDQMPQTYFERITFDPQIMGGRACIRGMRITVSLVLSLVANDMAAEEILEAYPYLEAEDIKACLRYADLPPKSPKIGGL